MEVLPVFSIITLGSSDVKYKTTNTITVPAVLRISIHYTSMALLYHLLHYNTRCIARRFSTYPTLNMLHRKKIKGWKDIPSSLKSILYHLSYLDKNKQ